MRGILCIKKPALLGACVSESAAELPAGQDVAAGRVCDFSENRIAKNVYQLGPTSRL
jgi:hypothetical protein